MIPQTILRRAVSPAHRSCYVRTVLFACDIPRAIDGDTLACANLSAHVRLLAIDAPELAGHCRKGRTCTPGDGEASKRLLASLIARGKVECQGKRFDRYGRILARCTVGPIDLSCTMVASRAAVERYSPMGRCQKVM